ncbi:DUF4893 domain-containing protein [Sphingomicrobium sediminis]|uniref:DUF4893 domain-containing protein n=1 Tax=Sphingomicrobium sediminis TaxID=2950949 RepID=A0A9X2EI36_9SPHN|nr:DUF4893 domain-containing protein [Sphingomicrobium sediminis]MCM8558465.1 DUF4893 domain-containing protein [Sphingomicrobium sediminis]
MKAGLPSIATVSSLALLLGGCALMRDIGIIDEPPPPEEPVVVMVQQPEPDPDAEWQSFAAPADLDRLERLDEAWAEGLAATQAAGFDRAVEEEGVLLEADAGLERSDPTPGSYRCRLVKLGAAENGDPAFIAYQPFFCYVQIEGDIFTIVKQTGSQRPAGRLWEATGDRYIFLGSLALGNEREPLAYGDDPSRDMAGVWERVGPFRWRLVIPYPRNGGILDVFELLPTDPQP